MRPNHSTFSPSFSVASLQSTELDIHLYKTPSLFIHLIEVLFLQQSKVPITILL